MPTKVFWCEHTGEVEEYLGRISNDKGCAGRHHIGRHSYGRRPVIDADRETHSAWPPDGSPLWPAFCLACGFIFTDRNSTRMSSLRRIMRRTDTGSEIDLSEAPVGACWDMVGGSFSPRAGEDGRYLIVQTPGGPWAIDSRAKNCTLPADNEHRCWVRHGRPEDGTLHVDKKGRTCAAGAGSIMAGNYHGFLHNGVLTDG